MSDVAANLHVKGEEGCWVEIHGTPGLHLDSKTHKAGFIIAIVGPLITLLISVLLIIDHLRFYRSSREQPLIIHIIIFAPIFSILSALAYIFYHQSPYIEAVRDFFEACTIGVLQLLFLRYIDNVGAVLGLNQNHAHADPTSSEAPSAGNTETKPESADSEYAKKEWVEARTVFGGVISEYQESYKQFIQNTTDPENPPSPKEKIQSSMPYSWMYPFGRNTAIPWLPPLKKLSMTDNKQKRTYGWISFGVAQYLVVKLVLVVVIMVTQALNVYCPQGIHTNRAYIWVMLVDFISISIALYFVCFLAILVQTIDPKTEAIKKFTAIKLIVFVIFWTGMLVSFADEALQIKPTQLWTKEDIIGGIKAIIAIFVMFFSSIFNLWAFPIEPYMKEGDKRTPCSGWLKVCIRVVVVWPLKLCCEAFSKLCRCWGDKCRPSKRDKQLNAVGNYEKDFQKQWEEALSEKKKDCPSEDQNRSKCAMLMDLNSVKILWEVFRLTFSVEMVSRRMVKYGMNYKKKKDKRPPV